MSITPYILIGESDRRALEAKCHTALADWSSGWGLSDGVCRVTDISSLADRFSALENCDAIRCVFTDGMECFILTDAQISARLIGGSLWRIVGGVERDMQRGGLLYDLAVTSLRDLMQSIFDFKPLHELEVQREVFGNLISENDKRPGSGTVALSMSAGGSDMVIVAPWVLCEAICRRAGDSEDSRYSRSEPAPMVRCIDAMDAELVPVKVFLGQIELSLESLNVLQQGDVIKLDASLDEPAKVYVGYGDQNFDADLGKRNSNLSVRLTS